MVGGGALLAYRHSGLDQGAGTSRAAFPFFPFPPLPPSPAMFPFVDRLPIPSVLKPVGVAPNPHGRDRTSPYYEVTMIQVLQKLHRDLPTTAVWTYAGTYPGPSFEVTRGQPVAVKWINNLPQQHPLRRGHRSYAARRRPRRTRYCTVVHLHGGKTMPESDGHPEAWFTRGFAETGPFPNSGIFYYTNDQPSAMLWFNDHAIAITRLNVMADWPVSTSSATRARNHSDWPSKEYEIPLAFKTKRSNQDGSIFMPRSASSRSFTRSGNPITQVTWRWSTAWSIRISKSNRGDTASAC